MVHLISTIITSCIVISMFRLAILLWAACAVHAATTNWEHSKRPASGKSGACKVDARLDLAGKNPPVLLLKSSSGEYELAEPKSRSKYNVYLDLNNKNILIACPGDRNSLKLGGRTVKDAEATCRESNGVNYFVINGKEYKTDAVECSSRVTPYEYSSKESCNGDGTLLKLGYMINDKIYDLIHTCHRVSDGMTYFSRHILDGSGLPERGNGGKRHDEEGRPKFSFQNKILFKGFPPYKFYYADAELDALSNAIGSSAASEIFNHNKDKFFAKGHFSPNADFILETSRDVSFMFVNVQPQWQEINGGNWEKVEQANRYNAAATGKKYEVITGANGTLKPKSKGVYLDYSRQRLPVPESYTKLVREVESNKCIAFVSTNFPADTTPKTQCDDICDDYKWPSLKDVKQEGYVYCCSYDQFKKAFPKSAPSVDCSGGTLENKNQA